MLRFIIRRVLQMIPTVLGVILITFILFNVVGGSPATMTLGKHVSPRALEDFDELRGFNKPLFFGWWAKTRALPTETFERNAGAWRQVAGAAFVENAGVRLTNDAVVPLSFPLQPTNSYRLTITYRLTDGASAVFQGLAAEGCPSRITRLEKQPFAFSSSTPLRAGKAWKTLDLDFQTGIKPTETDLVFRVAGGALDLHSVKLQRGMSKPYDSQLAFYLWQIAHFDFGESSSLNQPVSRLLLQGMGPSLL
ncbi:MAG: hypothetical protein NTY53_09345, partial [Kiritimatiellaeota bacterium]|nr:hypothetical protein [Kiritimatiellota bacterium]